ncbi:hypothetical protein FRC11_011728, partial [Ceratobasidium sp. 423]
VAALPVNMRIAPRAFYDRRSSNSAPNGNPTVIIIAVLAAVLLIFALFIVRGYQKRRKEKRSSTQQARADGSRGSLDHRDTTSYTSLVEQADNSQTETRGAEMGANNASVRSTTRQPRMNRRPSQNSTKSLPAYKERLPDGEIVLVERRTPNISENSEDYHNGDATESTPLTGDSTLHIHTGGDSTPEMPHAALMTTSSRTGNSVNYPERWQGQLESPGSNGGATVPSVNTTELERVDARVSLVCRLRDTATTAAPPYGNVPTYDEATALAVGNTVDTTEAVLPHTGSDSASRRNGL